ncbi:MAG: preQ(1) synthase [Bacteroidales bacterium]|nr:preQ(1) synthase [Bacteroidales bacterium]
MDFKYLGKRTTQPTKTLDTFLSPEGITHIRFESDELTSFCPVTGQPDFSKVIIEYVPDKLCIESKSLKLYLWSFREEAIFAEGLASRIAEDIFAATNPRSVKVTIVQNVRGGIQLTAVAEKLKM